MAIKNNRMDKYSRMFTTVLGIGKHSDNPTHNACMTCKSNCKFPLIPFWVGDKYGERKKIVFAGKSHLDGHLYGFNSDSVDSVVADLLPCNDHSFWRISRNILNLVYTGAEYSWDYSIVTNLIKCSTGISGDSVDKTSQSMVNSCLYQTKIFFEEMKIAKPDFLIIYAHSLLHDEDRFVTEYKESTSSISFNKLDRLNSKYYFQPYHLQYNDHVTNILITRHPQGTTSDYQNMIVDWILSK